jgi:hypothetical protein
VLGASPWEVNNVQEPFIKFFQTTKPFCTTFLYDIMIVGKRLNFLAAIKKVLEIVWMLRCLWTRTEEPVSQAL